MSPYRDIFTLDWHFSLFCFAITKAKPILRSSLHLNPADTAIHTCIHSLQHAIHSIRHIEISQVVTFQYKMSPVVTFPHRRHFSFSCFAKINTKPITQIIPTSQSSWHKSIHIWIHSSSACYSFNHNRNITSGDISVKMSPVVTFSHGRHFSLFCFAIINAKPILRSSLHLNPADTYIHTSIHFFQQAIHSTTIEISPSGDISVKMSPVVTFSQQTAIQPFWLCNNQCETDTQIISSISIQLTNPSAQAFIFFSKLFIQSTIEISQVVTFQ